MMSDQGKTRERAVDRRRFLTESARTACGVALLAAAVGFHARRATALPAAAIRPPGALPEARFLAACIRCGRCVRDCPYATLRLAQPQEDVAVGTPYFRARDVPCEMCEDLPCVKACPTGALDPALTDVNAARMGLAVVVDHETCLNHLGLRCDVCYRVCPLIGEAITLVPRRNPRTGLHAAFIPTVHSARCTGCGKCEKACVLDEAAIRVLPPTLAKGELGRHYRLGWDEKAKAGGELVPGVVDVPDRMPLPQAPGKTPAAHGEVEGEAKSPALPVGVIPPTGQVRVPAFAVPARTPATP